MAETVNWFMRVDPELDADVREIMEREERDLKFVVVRSVRAYIAQSKAEARAAKQQAKQAPQVAA